MKRLSILLATLSIAFLPFTSYSQVDEDQTGAWYMYFWSTTFGDSQFGMQGDIQYRNWNIMGDLEQLLLRGGFTFQPKDTPIKFTLGYGNITTGAFGDSQETTSESRIYQEALLSQKIGTRFNLRHRFRYEQRFVEGQDTRTRWRYAIFLDVPLNKPDTGKGAIYLALYNELFINGEKDIGRGFTVQVFDRNRLYGGLGYSIDNRLKTQLGYMRQKTNAIGKNQLQVSLHHSF
ncbi:MAG: DUF2490 domain-containing protein [Saprospiraceae bacterium]|nr:DUF2490 domain-containing protein [Lewinella sp.]